MADIAVRAVLQVAVGGRVACESEQRTVRAVGETALVAEVVEAAAEEKVVAVVEEQRLTVGQTLGPAQGGDGCALGNGRQRNNTGVGPVCLDLGVDGEVADVLFQHHKGEVGAVDVLLDAAGSPVEKGLTGNFDQRLGADEAVLEEPAAPACHGEDEVEFRHSLDSFYFADFCQIARGGAERQPPFAIKVRPAFYIRLPPRGKGLFQYPPGAPSRKPPGRGRCHTG